MRTYWHGEGKISRISLPPVNMRDTNTQRNLPQLLAASFWVSHAAGLDESPRRR